MWLSLGTSGTTAANSDSIAELRDAAGVHMTSEQIAEATRLAREWRSKPPAQQ